MNLSSDVYIYYDKSLWRDKTDWWLMEIPKDVLDDISINDYFNEDKGREQKEPSEEGQRHEAQELLGHKPLGHCDVGNNNKGKEEQFPLFNLTSSKKDTDKGITVCFNDDNIYEVGVEKSATSLVVGVLMNSYVEWDGEKERNEKGGELIEVEGGGNRVETSLNGEGTGDRDSLRLAKQDCFLIGEKYLTFNPTPTYSRLDILYHLLVSGNRSRRRIERDEHGVDGNEVDNGWNEFEMNDENECDGNSRKDGNQRVDKSSRPGDEGDGPSTTMIDIESPDDSNGIFDVFNYRGYSVNQLKTCCQCSVKDVKRFILEGYSIGCIYDRRAGDRDRVPNKEVPNSAENVPTPLPVPAFSEFEPKDADDVLWRLLEISTLFDLMKDLLIVIRMGGRGVEHLNVDWLLSQLAERDIYKSVSGGHRTIIYQLLKYFFRESKASQQLAAPLSVEKCNKKKSDGNVCIDDSRLTDYTKDYNSLTNVSHRFDLNFKRVLEFRERYKYTHSSNEGDVYMSLDIPSVIKIIMIYVLSVRRELNLEEYINNVCRLYEDICPMEISSNVLINQSKTDYDINSGRSVLGQYGLDLAPALFSNNGQCAFPFIYPEGKGENEMKVDLSLIIGHSVSSVDGLSLIYLPHYTLPWNWNLRLKAMYEMKDLWHSTEVSIYLSPTIGTDGSPPLEEVLSNYLQRHDNYSFEKGEGGSSSIMGAGCVYSKKKGAF